jgi:hypothetical protein
MTALMPSTGEHSNSDGHVLRLAIMPAAHELVSASFSLPTKAHVSVSSQRDAFHCSLEQSTRRIIQPLLSSTYCRAGTKK